MQQRRGKHIGLIFLLALVCLIGSMGWLMYRQIRQEKRNRALIAAIYANQPETAIRLLTEGADPNARDMSHQTSEGWMQTLRHLLDRSRGEKTAEPALALAMDTAQDDIVQALLAHGADPDNVPRWRLLNVFPHEEAAIESGLQIIALMHSPQTADTARQAKAWTGKRVAFNASSSSMPSAPFAVAKGVGLDVQLVPAKTHQPFIWEVCVVVGIVKAIDLKRRVIFIRANVKDWCVLDTG